MFMIYQAELGKMVAAEAEAQVALMAAKIARLEKEGQVR